MPSLPASHSRLPCVPCKCLLSKLQTSDSPMWHPRKRYSNHGTRIKLLLMKSCPHMNCKNSFYVKTNSKTIHLDDRFGYQFILLLFKLFNMKAFCISLSAAVSHQPFAFSFCICPFSVDRVQWWEELRSWEWGCGGRGGVRGCAPALLLPKLVTRQCYHGAVQPFIAHLYQ